MIACCNEIESTSKYIDFDLKTLQSATMIQELVDVNSIRLSENALIGLNCLNASKTTRKIGGKWLEDILAGIYEYEMVG